MEAKTTLQEIELDIFKRFKRLCQDYNLRYFAIGGTCIGAIRHNGFIPWDDDIDVAMPLEDYIKLKEIAMRELEYPYSLYTTEKNRHWYAGSMKMQNENTTFIEKDCFKYEDRHTGAWIDIMPVYGLPQGSIKQYFASILCDIYLFLNRRFRLDYDQQMTIFNKVLWKLLKGLNRDRNFNYYIEKSEKVLGKYPFDNSNKIIFSWRQRPYFFRKTTYKSVFFYEDFKKDIEVPFEDTTIKVPIGYDRYLRMDFGDYMQLPPLDKRVPRHNADIIDMNQSYRYYMEEQKK